VTVHHPWTVEDIEILKLFYAESSNNEMARMLQNHPKGSIAAKATDLGFRKSQYPWNRGLHGDPRVLNTGTFQRGHKPVSLNLWSQEEIQTLITNYATTSVEMLINVLPKREITSIYAKAHKLQLGKNKQVGIANRAKSLSKLYQEHPEKKDHLRLNGLRLARSLLHHIRQKGEYFLPIDSRKKISQTISKRLDEDPALKAIALAGLAKGREKMRVFGYRTAPEIECESFLRVLNIPFSAQYNLGAYYIDFGLPESKIALLVDGCYWHCCPIHFPQPKYKEQLHNLIIDRVRDRIIKEHGWKPLHIWECELSLNLLKERLDENSSH